MQDEVEINQKHPQANKKYMSFSFYIIFLIKFPYNQNSKGIKIDSSMTHHSLTTAPVYWNIYGGIGLLLASLPAQEP